MDWDELSMAEKASLMKTYVKNGIYTLDEMRKHYSSLQTPSSRPYSDGDPTRPDYAAMAKVVTNRNKDKNFVQRALNPNKYPHLTDNKGNNVTHLMTWSDDGESMDIYPTVVYDNGKLKQLDDDEAFEYAMKNNERINIPISDFGDWYSQNGLINHKEFAEGGKLFNWRPPEDFIQTTYNDASYIQPSDNTRTNIRTETLQAEKAKKAQEETNKREHLESMQMRPLTQQDIDNVEAGHYIEDFMAMPANDRLNKAAYDFTRTSAALGLPAALVTNPVGTVAALSTGMLGGYGVNKGVSWLSDNKYPTFANWLSNATNGKIWEENAEFLNPGFWIGGGVGNKIGTRAQNNIKLLYDIYKGNHPVFEESMYRRIDNNAYTDLQKTGVVRPNPNGVFSKDGHIQSGTWWSKYGEKGGGKIRYPGNILVQISEKHPQFPTKTTPGTEGLGYRLGDMEIDAFDPNLKVLKEVGNLRKEVPKKDYVPQMSFLDFWKSNTLNKLRHPFDAEAIRLLGNKGIQNFGKYLSKNDLETLMSNIKNLKIYNKNDYTASADGIFIKPKTLDEWSILHELGHHFDINSSFSKPYKLKMPKEYSYNKMKDTDIEFREFFADLFATKQASKKPFDYFSNNDLKNRFESTKNIENLPYGIKISFN